jgi:hypothetical protein
MKQIRALRSSKEFQLILAITACNGLPFVLAPAKAAALGPADRGHFAYFQAALLIMINISVFGARWSVYKNRLDGHDCAQTPPHDSCPGRSNRWRNHRLGSARSSV